MGNLKLEKLQKKARDKDLKRGKISVTCNDTDVICDDTAEINLESEGIRLHFLRYGLFDEETSLLDDDVEAPKERTEIILVDKNGETYVVDKNTGERREAYSLEEVVIDSDPFGKHGMPNLELFKIARTALVQGYIYLINDEDPDEYYELEVDENGMLSHVLWEYSKDKDGNYLDIRKREKEKISYKIVEKGKKLRMAFSPVQWSRDYFIEVNESEKKKKELMQLIDCSGFPKDHEAEDIDVAVPFHQIKAAFPPNHLYTSKLEDNLEDIFNTEKEQSKIEEEGGQANEVLEDMFITFHDPLALTDDVATILANKVANLQALVESLGTGKDPEEIKKRILKNEPKPETKKGSREEQIAALLATALTTYQLVYNSDEMIRDYDGGEEGRVHYDTSVSIFDRPIVWDGNGIIKQKLIDILAVKERKKLREEIIGYRKDFAVLLASDYYTKYFSHYKENGFVGLLAGKKYITEHANLLAISPDNVDSYLDLKSERGKYAPELMKKNKEANDFFVDFIKGKNTPVHKLLDQELDLGFLDDNETILGPVLTTDLANLVAEHINGSLEAYVALAKTTKRNTKLTFNRLKKITHGNSPVWQTRKKELEALLKKEGVVLDRSKVKFKGHKNGHRLVRIKDIDEISLLNEYNPKGPNTLKVPSETIPKKTAAQVKGAQRVFNSIHFAKGVYYLQILNITTGTYQLIDSGFAYKNILNLSGITADLTSAFFNLQRAQLVAKGAGEAVVENALARSNKWAKRGGLITAAVCVWEAYDSFKDNDNDAAFLWAGAGALFFTGIYVTGPIGWVVGGLAIGLVYLASYFKDGPLEKYFKHYWLSDLKALPRNYEQNEAPWEYINRVYEERTTLIKNKEDYKSWEDLRVCYQQLLDLMACSNMYVNNFKLGKAKNYSVGGEDDRAGVSFQVAPIKQVTIETAFRQFLWSAEQYEYRAFVVNNKSSSHKEIDFKDLNGKTEVVVENDRATATKTTITIPRWVHKFSEENVLSITQLVFICKLRIDDTSNKYYPHTYVGKERFMGIKMPLWENKITDFKNMDGALFPPKPTEYADFYYKNVRIDTLDDLLKWGKKFELKI